MAWYPANNSRFRSGLPLELVYQTANITPRSPQQVDFERTGLYLALTDGTGGAGTINIPTIDYRNYAWSHWTEATYMVFNANEGQSCIIEAGSVYVFYCKGWTSMAVSVGNSGTITTPEDEVIIFTSGYFFGGPQNMTGDNICTNFWTSDEKNAITKTYHGTPVNAHNITMYRATESCSFVCDYGSHGTSSCLIVSKVS